MSLFARIRHVLHAGDIIIRILPSLMKLTSSETVVPPVSPAEIRLEIVGGPADDDDGRRDQCPYAQEHAERQDDDAETLQQTRVRYFHGLRRLHSEDHGYPATKTSQIFRFFFFNFPIAFLYFFID